MDEGERKELVKAAAPRLAIYAIVVASPYIVGAFAGGAETETGLIFAAGLNAPMLAFVILALQFVIRGRFDWIEKPVGLARVLKFHKLMGIVAGLLIIAHPTLMAVGAGNGGMFTSGQAPLFVWIGRVAFLLIVVTIAHALARQAYKMDYRTWLVAHNTAAAIILTLGFYHSMSTQADLAPVAMRVWWTAIFAMAVVSYIHGKVVESRRRRAQAAMRGAA